MFTNYKNMPQKDKDTFTSVGNKLLNHSFICKIKDYYEYLFILKHSEFINDYFKPLGYELRINTDIAVAQLVNTNNRNHKKLTLSETIILIILRILYEEECKKLTQEDNIAIKLEDIHEKFLSLKIQDKVMNQVDLKKALITAKHYNLINLIDNNIKDENSIIEIYPSILMLISREVLDNTVLSLSNKKIKNKETEEDNINEEID